MRAGEHEKGMAGEPRGSRDRQPRAGNDAPITGRHARVGPSASVADMYLNCPPCGLAIAQTLRSRPLAHCPRCLGRGRGRVGMFASTLRAEQLYANGAPSAERDDRREPVIARADRER